MQRIRSIFSLICCITITLVMLVVGVMAATTVSLGVSLTVNYEPEVVAKVYVATSNATSAPDNNYYFSGTGSFPTTSYLVADNYTPSTISSPTITNAVCDTFGYYTIYVKVYNYSAIAIQVDITMTKSDGTPSTKFTIVENNGVDLIDARFDTTIDNDFAVFKVRATQTATESLKFTVNLSQAT